MRNLYYIGLAGGAIGGLLCILGGLLSLLIGLGTMANGGGSTLPPLLYVSFGLYFIGKGCFLATIGLLTMERPDLKTFRSGGTSNAGASKGIS